ncbi:MAG: hypothetical protein V4471_01535 [Pseudomonadota bacterium]
MIKIQFLALSIGFSFLIPFTAHADTKSDPLQYYRNEIKQAQADATQTVLDKLKPYTENASRYQNNDEVPPPIVSSPQPSNSEKAFSPPTTTQKKRPSDTDKSSTNNNPWLKPNPWEAQSKINPWANKPIPGPTPITGAPPTANTLVPNSTPNIFAPPQPPHTTNKTFNNNTNISY